MQASPAPKQDRQGNGNGMHQPLFVLVVVKVPVVGVGNVVQDDRRGIEFVGCLGMLLRSLGTMRRIGSGCSCRMVPAEDAEQNAKDHPCFGQAA